MEQIKNAIQNGKTVLGIELGSTRIKAVLIDENNNPIASGSYEWENRLENGFEVTLPKCSVAVVTMR